MKFKTYSSMLSASGLRLWIRTERKGEEEQEIDRVTEKKKK